MKLSSFLSPEAIIRDGNFRHLGYVDSTVPESLVFCNSRFYIETAAENPNVSCIITTPQLKKYIGNQTALAISKTPRIDFYKVHHAVSKVSSPGYPRQYGIGKNCTLHPTAVISRKSRIGDNVTISENVVIKAGVNIDDGTFIDANAIIGCDGLLYYRENNQIRFVKHSGGVRIGKGVTILSGAVIARSVHDTFLTTVDDHSIIGITSNIGHEVQINKNCVISSNCVIARRAVIEVDSWVGPSSMIREHVRVGAGAQIKLGSIVIDDVEPGKSVSGNFAMNHHKNLRRFMNEKQR